MVECLNPRASAHDAQEWECIENTNLESGHRLTWDDVDKLETERVRGSQDCAVVARRASGSNIELVLAVMAFVAATIWITPDALLEHICGTHVLAIWLTAFSPCPCLAQYVCTETEIKGTLDGNYCMKWTGNIVGRNVRIVCIGRVGKGFVGAGRTQEARSCGHESTHPNQRHSRAYNIPGIRAHGLHSHSAIQTDLSSHKLGLLLISMHVENVTLCNRRVIM